MSNHKIWNRIGNIPDTKEDALELWSFLAIVFDNPQASIEDFDLGPRFEDVSDKPLATRLAWMMDARGRPV